jgi:hypothetical protein
MNKRITIVSDKSWYQVKNIENAEMFHRGFLLKPKQLVYLDKEQASLHNRDGENLIEANAPKSILDAAFAEEFNEWDDLHKNALEPKKDEDTPFRVSRKA